MKFIDWLKKWNFEGLSVNAYFLEVEMSFTDADKEAAWEMYVELLTRITTQQLLGDEGDEQTALSSIYSIFPTTRGILKKKGRNAIQFTKIAIIILNQVIRPFTAKWHAISLKDGFAKAENQKVFRQELSLLQVALNNYTGMLSDIAGVENLTKLQEG